MIINNHLQLHDPILTYLNYVGNAKLFGALDDMHLSGQDWNTALCVFFATYALGGV